MANPATARANLGDGTATHVMHGDGTLTQVVTGDVTDLAVTTAKIADGAVDAAKLNDTITMSNSKVINFAAVGDTNGKGLILPDDYGCESDELDNCGAGDTQTGPRGRCSWGREPR